jgi:hypothetical protein
MGHYKKLAAKIQKAKKNFVAHFGDGFPFLGIGASVLSFIQYYILKPIDE